MITVAVCQIAPPVADPDQAHQQIGHTITEAARHGAHVVVLPELANSGYSFQSRHELEDRAESIPGKTTNLLEELAAKHQLVIVSGLAETDAGTLYNAAVLVDETGVRTSYRKVHLWDTEKISGFTPGHLRPPVVDTPYGRIGIMICYDLEFPEWVRLAALDHVELLCAPVNWPFIPRPEGERPGEIIRAQANAAVNRMFVAAADRTGTERGQTWLGGSVIINPDGYPVTELNLGDQGIMTATINLTEARDKAISAHNDVHADRRSELYGDIQS